MPGINFDRVRTEISMEQVLKHLGIFENLRRTGASRAHRASLATTVPRLSMANVRTMLLAAMPLPQLTSQEAAYLVVKHLDNRTRSRKSRLRSGSSP